MEIYVHLGRMLNGLFTLPSLQGLFTLRYEWLLTITKSPQTSFLDLPTLYSLR